jgi:pimeloyl-ACP methyl ester carboxylesterase
MADVVARGVRFHVQHLGEGRPDGPLVVFLHGLVMDNLSSWYFTVANPVAAFADVLLYDLRGHGKSERVPSGYTLVDMVEDLAAVLDAAAPGRSVHLVGNSFGGLLALAFARAFPVRVESIALVDAHLGSAGFGEQMASTLSLEGEERDRRIAESFKDWLGRHSDRKKNRLAEAASQLVKGTTLMADMRATPQIRAADFAGIDVPVLAIYGERSELREVGEVTLRGLARCKLVVVPGSTHSVLWEATEQVRREIVDFVRGVVSTHTRAPAAGAP